MEKVEKGLTLRSLLLGLILVAGLTVLLHLFGGFTPNIPGETANSLVIAILVMFLFSLIGSKLRLTPQEQTVIYSMILVSIVFAATWTFLALGQIIELMGSEYLYAERYAIPYMNPILGPKVPKLIKGAFAGGAEVPWEVWMGPMFFWILLSLTICFSGLFLSCIMRRQYVDVETLPFPVATPALTLMKGPSFLRLPNVRYILLGMLIGFVWPPTLISFLNQLYPPLAIPTPGALDLSPYLWSVLPMAVLFIGWGNIALLAFALLVPTDILLTVVVLNTVFLWIIPPIEVALGVLHAPAEYGVAGKVLWRYSDAAFQGAVHSAEILWYGGMLGLGIIPLIYEWRHIAQTLKAVIHPKPEIEASEPLPYRWAWTGFIAMTIATLLLMFIAGMPLWIGVIFLALFNVLNLGFTRLRGESGGWMGNGSEMHAPVQVTLHQIGFATRERSLTSACFSAGAIPGPYTVHAFGTALGPPITVTEAFRIASITKTRNRDLFVSISIAIIVAMLIGFPFALWGIYNYGITARWLYSRIDFAYDGTNGGWQAFRVLWAMDVEPVGWTYPPNWIQTLFGVVLVGVFTLLRTRYVWFPLNPVGIPLAGFFSSVEYAFLWFVAFVIKYAALKIGGTKLYEEKMVPIAVGIIVMSALTMFVTGLVTLLRVA